MRVGTNLQRGMTDVRDLIRRKIKEHELSMKAVSERMGRSHSYIQQFLERGVPAKLPEEDRAKLATILQVPEAELKNATVGKVAINRTPFLRIPATLPGDKIPVMGASEGGTDGMTPWNGDIVDWIDRPPQLVGATQGFATYVVGCSMEPRYFHGELIFIHPGRPPGPGDFVLVQLKPDGDGEAPRAFVKRLVRRTATKLVLAQYNPAKEIELAAKDVLNVQKIVGSGVSG